MNNKSSISNLISECLLPILDRLPLSSLLSIRLVCTRWNSLFPAIANRKRTIALLHKQPDVIERHLFYDSLGEYSGQPVAQYAHNCLVVGDLSSRPAQCLATLVQLFPAVAKLEWRQLYWTSAYEGPLRTLLSQWGEELSSLTIFLYDLSDYKRILPPTFWTTLLDQIETQCPALKHLIFGEVSSKSNDDEHEFAKIDRLPSQLLQRLETFHCGVEFQNGDVSLRQIAIEGKRLKHFGLLFREFAIKVHQYTRLFSLGDLRPVDDTTYPAITKLRVGIPLEEVLRLTDGCPHNASIYRTKLMQDLVRCYPALTHLHCTISGPVEDLLDNSGLHQLQALRYLRIYNWYWNANLIEYGCEPPQKCWLSEQQRQAFVNNPRALPLYRNLETIHLEMVPTSRLFWALPLFMPALSTLRMDMSITPADYLLGRQVFDSLSMLTQLKRVIYNGIEYPNTRPDEGLKLDYYDPYREEVAPGDQSEFQYLLDEMEFGF